MTFLFKGVIPYFLRMFFMPQTATDVDDFVEVISNESARYHKMQAKPARENNHEIIHIYIIILKKRNSPILAWSFFASDFLNTRHIFSRAFCKFNSIRQVHLVYIPLLKEEHNWFCDNITASVVFLLQNRNVHWRKEVYLANRIEFTKRARKVMPCV